MAIILHPYEKVLVLKYRKEGKSIREITELTGRHSSTVRKIIREAKNAVHTNRS